MSGEREDINVHIKREIRPYCEKNLGMRISKAIEYWYELFRKNETEYKEISMLEQIKSNEKRADELKEEYKRTYGRSYERTLVPEVELPRNPEDSALDRLYEAMSPESHGKWLHLDAKRSMVISWIDARKSGFGLILSSDEILQRLRKMHPKEAGKS